METTVRIEFLVSGQYSELKLASGMTSPGRVKDLADVQELIKTLKLPAFFADQLNEYVRGKYMELWQGASESAGDEGD